jgi:putative oxidoreductase
MKAPSPRDLLCRVAATNAPAAALLIRIAVGGIFLSEGIQKFLSPVELGVGRFTQIGIPAPAVMATFVGVVEIGCGFLLIVGLLTRLATVPLVVDMAVAIATTKAPILLKSGFWKMAHEAGTDYAMLLGCSFLALVGAGAYGRALIRAARPSSLPLRSRPTPCPYHSRSR